MFLDKTDFISQYYTDMAGSCVGVYISFASQPISNNSSIPIQFTRIESPHVTLDPAVGNFSFNTEGVYLLFWWFNLDGGNNLVALVRTMDQETIATSFTDTSNIVLVGNTIQTFQANTTYQFINDIGSVRNLVTAFSGYSLVVTILKIG